MNPFPRNHLKIAVLGGGTGSFTLLSALKHHSHSIAAIVNMADDGGSTGVLRDELGTLPPGDIRQCLVALSDSPKIRDLFNYRFNEGTFAGHAFGNLLLSALEKMTGDFSEAVETASEILRINGVVIPATLDDVRLRMTWPEESLTGEAVIDAKSFDYDPRRAELALTPQPVVNPDAIAAITQADLVVIAPGDLYTSLGPLLVIDGIGDALLQTDAVKIYVSNLVTKQGQTDGFDVADHAAEIERFAGGAFLDYVLYNDQKPAADLLERYEREGGQLVVARSSVLKKQHYQTVGGRFLGEIAKAHKGDKLPVTRSLIRHDAPSIARALMEVYRDAKS
ncbi:MAG TPA: gluconeogenesis factor YvcK family protein [Candidatus Saccharimonadales bacterium]|nr:gluconeogenesis factor YvcK family protein [Candidatus Saccharimonadales bacterium]